jgi:hypothetical protein
VGLERPGRPGAVERARSQAILEAGEMPPGPSRVDPAVLELVKKWIEEGAKP